MTRASRTFAVASVLGAALGAAACSVRGTIGIVPSDGGQVGATDAPAIEVDASTSIVSALCPNPGWCTLPNTKLEDVCPSPSPGGITGCRAVLFWSGAAADLRRQRLLLWGGGTTNYWGNEVYALDLMRGKMSRLTEPTPVDATTLAGCPEDVNGAPNGRATYGGLFVGAASDRLYAFGGQRASPTNDCNDTTAIWALDLQSATWSRVTPAAPDPMLAPFLTSAVHPDTGAAYLAGLGNDHVLFRYDDATNVLTRLRRFSDFGEYVAEKVSAAIAPRQNRFFLVGGVPPHEGFKIASLADGSDHALEDWTTRATGCDALTNVSAPGLAYDSKRDRLVAWTGGARVLVIDPETVTCTEQSFPNAPGEPQGTGTYGRFRYFPALDAFVLVNAVDEDVYVLRLP